MSQIQFDKEIKVIRIFFIWEGLNWNTLSIGESFQKIVDVFSCHYPVTMVDNSQKYRLQHWATRSSVRSFARTAHFALSLARGKVNF